MKRLLYKLQLWFYSIGLHELADRLGNLLGIPRKKRGVPFLDFDKDWESINVNRDVVWPTSRLDIN